MILGFKDQFAAPILNGTKIHSFRGDPNKRWRPGIKAHLFTGVRTKNMKLLKIEKCVSVQECVLVNRPSSTIMVFDDVYIFHWNKIIEIAKNDGFENPYHFVNFFFKKSEYGEKKLRCIHWTNFKYKY